jgi:hypothetical protein
LLLFDQAKSKKKKGVIRSKAENYDKKTNLRLGGEKTIKQKSSYAKATADITYPSKARSQQ